MINFCAFGNLSSLEFPSGIDTSIFHNFDKIFIGDKILYSSRQYFAGSYYAAGYANSRHSAYFDSQFHPNALSTATASAAYPASSVSYPSHLGGIGKTYPMGAAVQSGFSYSYPRGMHQVIYFLSF